MRNRPLQEAESDQQDQADAAVDQRPIDGERHVHDALSQDRIGEERRSQQRGQQGGHETRHDERRTGPSADDPGHRLASDHQAERDQQQGVALAQFGPAAPIGIDQDQERQSEIDLGRPVG